MDYFVINQLPVPLPFRTAIEYQDGCYWKITCKWPPMPEEEAKFLNRAICLKEKILLELRERDKTWRGWIVTMEKKRPYEFTHMGRKWVGSMTCSFWGIQE